MVLVPNTVLLPVPLGNSLWACSFFSILEATASLVFFFNLASLVCHYIQFTAYIFYFLAFFIFTGRIPTLVQLAVFV